MLWRLSNIWRSLRQSAVDLPLAQWLVLYGESQNYPSGREMARRMGLNPAVFGTWLRGEHEPDPINQERMAEATGKSVAFFAELARQTRAVRAERAGQIPSITGAVPADPVATIDHVLTVLATLKAQIAAGNVTFPDARTLLDRGNQQPNG